MELLDSLASRHIGAVANPARPARRPLPPTTHRNTANTESDVMREVENGQTVWRISCGDMINRDRCVTVFADNGEVVVVGPPGETARLTNGQVGQLRAALNEAAKLAER